MVTRLSLPDQARAQSAQREAARRGRDARVVRVRTRRETLAFGARCIPVEIDVLLPRPSAARPTAAAMARAIALVPPRSQGERAPAAVHVPRADLDGDARQRRFFLLAAQHELLHLDLCRRSGRG